MRVTVAGGGTAGHVFPGLALAQALERQGDEIAFVGTSTGPEARLVPSAGFQFWPVRARPLTRKLSLSAVSAPVAALAAVRDCRRLVAGQHAVVGMGGYVSVPTVLAAWREQVPVILHEQNAVPGLANRALSRMAAAVALVFPDAGAFFPRRRRLVLTGNPVREEILRVRDEREGLAREAHQAFELHDDRKTIVVFGGSQGASHLNQSALGACRLLAHRRDLQVLLITGTAHLDAVRRALPRDDGGLSVRYWDFVDRMELVYAVADLVVARSGAGTVSEVSACGLPSILVPYPYATHQHQEANARALERAGGAAVLLDAQLTAESLAAEVEALIDDAGRRRAMVEGSRRFGRPWAAEGLARLVHEAAGK